MTYIAEISPDKKRNSLGSGLEIELYRLYRSFNYDRIIKFLLK